MSDNKNSGSSLNNTFERLINLNNYLNSHSQFSSAFFPKKPFFPVLTQEQNDSLREVLKSLVLLDKSEREKPFKEVSRHIKERNIFSESKSPFLFLKELEDKHGTDYVNNFLIRYISPTIKRERQVIKDSTCSRDNLKKILDFRAGKEAMEQIEADRLKKIEGGRKGARSRSEKNKALFLEYVKQTQKKYLPQPGKPITQRDIDNCIHYLKEKQNIRMSGKTVRKYLKICLIEDFSE